MPTGGEMLATILKWAVAFWRLILSILLLVFCVYCSWKGIDYAVNSSKCDADGGRGGAIAVAFTLFVIFLTPTHASDLYRKFKRVPRTTVTENVRTEIE